MTYSSLSRKRSFPCRYHLLGMMRWFLFVTNLIFCILCVFVMLGAALFLHGRQVSWISSALEQISAGASSSDSESGGLDLRPLLRQQWISIVMLTLAIFGFLIAFLGCGTACRPYQCWTVTYCLLVLSLFTGFLLGVVYFCRGDVGQQLQLRLEASLAEYDPASLHSKDKSAVENWDRAQQDFSCCGVNTWRDWQEFNPWFASPSEDFMYETFTLSGEYEGEEEQEDGGKKTFWNYIGSQQEDEQDMLSTTEYSEWQDLDDLELLSPSVPMSCCKNMTSCIYSTSFSLSDIYLEGCLSKGRQLLQQNGAGLFFKIVTPLMLIVMALNIVISCVLCTANWNRNYKQYKRAKMEEDEEEGEEEIDMVDQKRIEPLQMPA